MRYGDDQDMSSAGNFAITRFRLSRNYLSFGECNVALFSDRHDEMFPVDIYMRRLKRGPIEYTYARLGFDRQNQHSSAKVEC